MEKSRSTCKVTRDGKKKKEKAFFDKIGKFIVLFVVLGVASFFLSVLTVSVGYHFGGIYPIFGGTLYNDNSVFLGYAIGMVVTPFITVVVLEKRKKAIGK